MKRIALNAVMIAICVSASYAHSPADAQSLAQSYVWQFNVGATQGTGVFVDRGGVDIDDVVYLIAYVFSGGPAPVDIC